MSSGEYTFVPPVDKKTFSLTVSYAVPVTGKLSEADLPIPLLWPEEPTRTTTTTRIWLPPGKVYAGVKGPWREEPPTPSPDRDSWPTETISSIRNANEPAPSILLKINEATAGEQSVSHAIVERVFASAWLGDEGTRRIRARYSFSRWPSTGLEWEIPSETVAEFWLDGKRIEGSPIPSWDGSDCQCVRIPMPDSRLGRPSVTLDVRLTARSDKPESKTVSLPAVRNALYRTTPFWSIASSPGSLILDFRRELSNAMIWKWRGAPYGLSLVPSDPFEDLTFRPADENESDVASARPSAFGQSTQLESPMRFTLVPRTIFFLVCSGGILAFGFLLLNAPASRRGAMIATAVTILALAVMIWPQAIGQSIVAAQPGLAIGLCLFAVLSLRKRWQVRNRRSLSAFERLGVEPKALGDSSNDRTPGSQSRQQRMATPVPVPASTPASAAASGSTSSTATVPAPVPVEPR